MVVVFIVLAPSIVQLCNVGCAFIITTGRFLTNFEVNYHERVKLNTYANYRPIVINIPELHDCTALPHFLFIEEISVPRKKERRFEVRQKQVESGRLAENNKNKLYTMEECEIVNNSFFMEYEQRL